MTPHDIVDFTKTCTSMLHDINDILNAKIVSLLMTFSNLEQYSSWKEIQIAKHVSGHEGMRIQKICQPLSLYLDEQERDVCAFFNSIRQTLRLDGRNFDIGFDIVNDAILGMTEYFLYLPVYSILGTDHVSDGPVFNDHTLPLMENALHILQDLRNEDLMRYEIKDAHGKSIIHAQSPLDAQRRARLISPHRGEFSSIVELGARYLP